MMISDSMTNKRHRMAAMLSMMACAIIWLVTLTSHHHQESGGHNNLSVGRDFVSSSRLLASIIDEDQAFEGLFPIATRDIVGFVCAVAGLVLAAGAGIGGGGILVPIFILIFDFPIKHAIPLASVTVLGGAIANNLLNARKSHPDHPSRPVIDWDLIIQLEPMTMAGALIGADLNDMLPDVVLVVMLFLLLSITAYKTLDKAFKLYQKESDERSQATQQQEIATRLLDNSKSDDAAEVGSIPTDHSSYGSVEESPPSHHGIGNSISLDHQPSFGDDQVNQAHISAIQLSALFAVVTCLNLFKGGPGENGGGPLGLDYCGYQCFWITEFAMISVIVLFAIYTRKSVLKRVQSGGPILSEIEWDEEKTITYPLLAIIAGLVAGLFGVGGGIIKGPLMLALGVHPAVASATSAGMILFTSCTATVSYMVFELLIYDYAVGCIIVGFVATIAGQTFMSFLLRKYKRNSMIAFAIGGVVGVSAIAMTVESIIEVFF